jgi:hypothetical protein
MNKQPIVLGLGMLLLFSACRKNDLQSNSIEEVPEVVAATNEPLSNWRSVTNWNRSQTESQASYDVKFHDNRIDETVIQNGMVLVFLKKENNINALPFTENGKPAISWNYQVSENTLQINSDAGSDADLLNAVLTYFILSPKKIRSLEEKGHSKIDVMTFSYETANRLLN